MTERTIPKADMDAAIAAAEEKYPNLPKGLLAKMAQVESRYGEKLSNPSGARGPWQFMPKTGPQYGLMTEEDRMDPYKSADAAARLLLNNKKDLENRIGRTVSNGELYLAHQQGAAGAAKLLKDPNRNAAELVGAERVRQNLPKDRQADHAKLTTGEFAKLWTSKFDGDTPTPAAPAPGAPPAKKPEPRAASSLGALPGVTPTADFYSYNPNSLARLEQGSKALAQRNATPPALAELSTVPVEKGSISQLVTPPPAEPGAAPTPKQNRSTAILQGLSTVDKIARRNAMTAQTVEGVEPTRVAPSGVAGDFTAGVDAGMAGMEGDREYFGAIIDTLMGNEEGAKSHLMNADISSQQATQALAGLPSFEEFMNAPTLDGFISQMASATGQVAPSALESMAWALGTGGTFAIGKAGLSVGSKAVVNTLVKDMVTKKVKGEILEEAEEKVLDAMFKNFKRGAMAGAFGQEFVMGSGGAFQEFDEAGVELNSDRAVQALLWGVPQAAIGAGSEAFIVKTLGELALKKSTREAGDSVLKRFAADVLGATAKSAAVESGTETIQEGLSLAQRVSVDPTYSKEERDLRLAQAAFSGFFGGGLFGGAGATPAAGAGALRRTTVGEKIIKKANEFLQDASEARVETEVNQDTKNIDDGVITGDTAPESGAVMFEQFREMMDPKHPRKAVWAAASQNFGMEIPDNKVVAQEQTEDAYRGDFIYAGRVPGKGVIISPDRSVVDQVIHTSIIGGDVDAAIGEALGMGGPKGDKVIRVKKDGVVTHEQTFNEENRAAAEASAEAMANGDPNAVIDQPTIETALEERAQAVAAEKSDQDFFAAIVEDVNAQELAPDSKEISAVLKETNTNTKDLTDEELQKQMEAEDAAYKTARDPMSDDPKVIKTLQAEYGYDDYTDPNFEISIGPGHEGRVSKMNEKELAQATTLLEEGLQQELKRKSRDDEVVFSIRQALRAVANAKKAPKEPSAGETQKVKKPASVVSATMTDDPAPVRAGDPNAIDVEYAPIKGTPIAPIGEDTSPRTTEVDFEENPPGKIETRDMTVENHSQSTEPFLGKAVRPAPYHALSDPENSLSERKYRDELYKRVTDGDLTVEQVPLKGLVPTQTGISERFRDLPANKKLPLIVKFKGVSYIEDGHHRLAAAAERGDKAVEARVVDLDQKSEIETRDMTVDDSGDTTADEETTSEADVAAAEESLAASFEEIDNRHAIVIGTFKKEKRTRGDEDAKDFFFQLTAVIESLPYALRDMGENYEDYEEIMPQALLNQLQTEIEYNPEVAFAIRENENDMLELVRRDESTDPETIATRLAVTDMLKQVFKMGHADNNGVWFIDPETGKLERGVHDKLVTKTNRKTGEKYKELESAPGQDSYFYLYDTKPDKQGPQQPGTKRALKPRKRLFNLSGWGPAKDVDGLGRTAFMAMAQAGVALNRAAGIGVQGGKYTSLQKHRLGLQTMLAALLEAGYELRYSPSKDNAPIPVRTFKNLFGQASTEVAMFLGGKPYTLSQVFGGKLPLDKAGADFDPNTMGAQLEDSTENTTRSKVVSVDGERRTVADAQAVTRDTGERVRTAVDPNEQRALADALQKKKGGFDVEQAQSKKETAKARKSTKAVIDTVFRDTIAASEDTEMEQRAAAIFDQLPPGVTMELSQDGNMFRAVVSGRSIATTEIKATTYIDAVIRGFAAAHGLELSDANGRSASRRIEEMLGDVPEDVTISVRIVNGEYVATVSSPRYPDQKVESKRLRTAIIRAHAMAKTQPESAAVRYDRIGLEHAFSSTLDSQETERRDGTTDPKIPEIDGVRAPKRQSNDMLVMFQMPGYNPLSGANDVKVLGKLGTMTSKVLGAAMNKFLFRRPVIVTTLDSMKANFDKLVGRGGELEGFSSQLAETIARMELQDSRSPYGRVLMGDKNVIVLRDTPETLINPRNITEEVFNPDDALVGSVLAHEIGHIIFNQEYDLIDQKENKLQLWEAFVRFKSEMNVVPTDYTYTDTQVDTELARRKTAAARSFAAREETIDVFGQEETLEQWEKKNRASRKEVIQDYNKKTFEEWFADQVMAYVYNENKPTKNMREGYFKRLATAFKDFWHEINDFLRGRMKEATEKGPNKATGKTEIKWRFGNFMEQVVARHDALRGMNREVPMASRIMIREMTNNIGGRISKGAATKFNSVAKKIMGTGSLGNTMHKIQNLVQASTDFMKLSEHGVGGKALSEFFGTLSQNIGQLGWNKRKLFEENRLNNEFAKILGITEKSKPDEWESPRVTAILNEAEDNTIDDANLTSPEARAIRKLFADLYDKYLTVPGTANTWIDIARLRNYGGPRMFNAEKIAKNKTQFINWLLAHPTWRNRPDAQAAAEAVFSRITMHQGDIVANLNAEVDADIANGVFPNTPIVRASELFRRSMVDRAVATVRNKVFADARKGAGYSMKDLLGKVQADFPLPPPGARMSRAERRARQALHRVANTGTEAEMEAGLKTYWMSATQSLRLTPGMDPALERTLKQIETKELRNALPGDPNGWLHPQGLAISQYFHFVTRIVEYEKMGGYDYVSKQLALVPEAYRHEVDAAIMANLGKFSEYMSPKWRLFNSTAAVWTVFTTLLFATLTSVTDLAGVAVRSKDFANLNTYFNGMRQALSNKDWSDLARSVGVVTFRSQDHAMVGLGELDYANRASRSIMNGFFRYTGLEFFTKFSRTFATGMGREFLINTATKENFGDRESRYLAELNLTREDVLQWQADGERFDTNAGEKVRDAIARFADEAIIRPDASQRPTWASNPYFATVWQLKSYYYGFGKTIMGGMGREIQNRWSEKHDFVDAAGPMLLMALTIIPLTMLGLHSREWLKWLFQLALPGVPETAFKTSEMGGGEYMWEIFQRSGVLGPFALGLNTMEAFQFEGIAAPFTANIPMVDLFDDFVFDGDMKRPIPVLNNL